MREHRPELRVHRRLSRVRPAGPSGRPDHAAADLRPADRRPAGLPASSPFVAGPEGRPAATSFAHAGRLVPAGAATS